MPSSIFERYVSGGARAFYDGHFADEADRRRTVQQAVRPLAPSVADALQAQQRRYAHSEARADNLARLRRGAAAVVTGQQVGLFLGPLYTLYKAASAVQVARALSRETGQVVVPVFWLQTEDHDLPEIALCHLSRASGEPLALRLPASESDRISIAHQKLPPQLDAILASLHVELAELPYSQPHLTRLTRHYRQGATWGEAFAGVLAELFADEGLILLDPRDPALAAEAAKVHRRALVDAAPIARALVERVAELLAAGFEAPVHVRADAPLSFLHADGAETARYRLEASPTGYAELGREGRTHSCEALLALLEREPLCFSTSALLRPILQDSLLPTAAYVGGPGEIAYFAQLPPLYRAFGLPMPLLVPRARFRVVEARTQRLLGRLGLCADDAARSEAELLGALDAASDATPDATEHGAPTRDSIEKELVERVDRVIGEVLSQLPPVGILLDAALAKTRNTLRKPLSRLAQKYESLHLHRSEARVADVRRLKRLLYPLDQPQERVLGFSYFAARYGERPFIEQVLRAIDPFDATPKNLHP